MTDPPRRWPDDSAAENFETHRQNELDKLSGWARHYQHQETGEPRRLEGVTVAGLPTGPDLDPHAYCGLCLRIFRHPHHKLAPIPGHPGHRWCKVCRTLDNDPRTVAWWLAQPVGKRRQYIAIMHGGIDPWSWHKSRPRAEQSSVDVDEHDMPTGVSSRPVQLGVPTPRMFWDVRWEKPNSVKDAHPDIDVD